MTLGKNEKCQIVIDASAGVARLTLTNKNLGHFIPDYFIGEPLTIPEGEKRYYTLYNGEKSSTCRFELIYSSAVRAVLSATAAGASLLYLL